MSYKAFISYSHAHRELLASALERTLHRFGVPAQERAGLRFFRDTTNLSASPELWPDIVRALDNSEYLVLLASREAAASPWVTKEVAHWAEHRDAAHIILLLADGEIAWNTIAGDFDFDKSTALPRTISKVFSGEPRYVDLRGITPRQYDLAYPIFCDAVATIAATLHGKPKETLFGVYASTRIAAEAARLAAEADISLRDGFPERSLLLSSAALRLTDERGEPRSPAAETILRAGLRRFGGRCLGDIAPDWNARALRCTPEKRGQRIPTAEEAFKARPWGYTAADLDIRSASFSPDGARLALIGADGMLRVWRLDLDWRDRAAVVLESKGPVTRILFAGNSRWLIAVSDGLSGTDHGGTFRLWDLAGKTQAHDFKAAASNVMVSTGVGEDGSYLASDLFGTGVIVWKLPDSEKGDTPEVVAELPEARGASAMAFVTEPLRLVTTGADGTITVWNISSSDKDESPPLRIHEGAPGAIQQIAVSSDGKWLAANPTLEGKPLLWRIGPEFVPVSLVPPGAEDIRVWSVHFSPQSSWLLCIADTSYLALLRQTEPAAVVAPLEVTGGTVWNYSFSHDDLWLATATGLDAYEELALSIEPEYTVRVWDNTRFKPWRLPGHEDVVTGVAFIPQHDRLVSCSVDHTIRFWNWETAQRFQRLRISGEAKQHGRAPGGLEEHESEHVTRSVANPTVMLGADDPIFQAIVSSDGLWLLTISLGQSMKARLWLITNDALPAAPWHLPKPLSPEGLTLFSPDQNWFLFAELMAASGYRVRFSSNRRFLFITAKDNTILLFNVEEGGRQLPTLETQGAEITWVNFSPDEQWIAAQSKTEQSGFRELRLWNLSASNPRELAVEADQAFEVIEFSSDSRWFLGLQREKALLWDLAREDPFRDGVLLLAANPMFEETFSAWARVTFSADGHWLVNGAHSGGVALHDLRRPDFVTPTALLPVGDRVVATVAADCRGEFVVAGGPDGFARLWRIGLGDGPAAVMDLSGHELLEKAAFSSDKHWLVTADYSAIQLWDLSVGQCRCSIKKESGDVRTGIDLKFLAENRWLVIAKSNAVILIDLATPETAAKPLRLPGHDFEQVGFWFTPDHHWLVTADFPFDAPRGSGRVAAVRIWDLTSPTPAASSVSLPGLEAGVSRINISPDGRWLTTTSPDGVRVWPLGTEHLLEIADKVVGREFTEAERIRYGVSESAAV